VLEIEMSSAKRAEVDQSLFETLRTMVSEPERLTRTSLLSDFDIDSLDLVELTQVVEEQWGVSVETSDFADLETVEQVIHATAARLS
jgi:acyl carrier protein